jgi:hypothetical protein
MMKSMRMPVFALLGFVVFGGALNAAGGLGPSDPSQPR